MTDRVRRNSHQAEGGGKPDWPDAQNVLSAHRLRSRLRCPLPNQPPLYILLMYRADTSHRGIGQIHRIRWAPAAPGLADRRGWKVTGKRSGVLELAVLGLLHESPMHGYEL